MKIQLHCILILLSSISTSFSEGLITSYTNGIIEASENSGMWRLTGSSVYSTSEASDTNTTWEFKSKDTIMYNSDGRIVARFQSFSHTGWESDSIRLIDSIIYNGNRIVERLSKYVYEGKTKGTSTRESYVYFDNNKSYTRNDYKWDTIQQKWLEDTTYSITVVCSSPIENLYNDSNFNFSNLLKFIFTPFYTQKKIDSECNDTVVTLEQISERYSRKVIYYFNTQKLLRKNMSKEIILEKDSGSQYYDTLTKKIFNKNGYDFFNTSGLYEISYHLKDSHGNDTAEYLIDYRAYNKSYDTISRSRYLRYYDANGNNTETIMVFFDYAIGKWSIAKKVVNRFSQYTSFSKFQCRKLTYSNCHIVKRQDNLILSAPSISSVKLFNSMGRVVFLTKCNLNSNSINVANVVKKLNTGIYYISVDYGQNRQFSFPFFTAP